MLKIFLIVTKSCYFEVHQIPCNSIMNTITLRQNNCFIIDKIVIKHLYSLFLLLLIFFNTPLLAQSAITGNWKGVITQDDGGYRTKYDFELYIYQKDNQISGRSYVYVDDIYCEMKVEGTIQGGLMIHIRETAMVDSKQIDGMEWCFKKADLVLQKDREKYKLTGRWEGMTSFSNCIPGRVILQKIVPRA